MTGMLKDVITYTDPNSPTSETIRCLRTNILFLNMGKDSKVISLTSPAPQEGKTFLAANLAVATAQSKKKTLIIDFDLRRMGLSRVFGLGGKEGLSNVLARKNITLSNIPFCDVGIENFTVLPSGPSPPNPAELLEQEGVDTVLSIVRKEFDIIYVDVPPVLSVADPIIVCKKTDGVILVVMADSTPQKAALRTYSLLKEAGINIMGTVLNKVDAGLSGLYRYKYRYRYYYSK
ncbi:MAG: CpsD/CapB family tyrosine-protein kinase [Candidatus Omnitrophota bacterium]